MSKELKLKTNSLPIKACKPVEVLPRLKTLKAANKGEEDNSTKPENETLELNSGCKMGEIEFNEKQEEGEECFICTEKRDFISIGQCNHKVCYLCSLRMRSLYNDDKCPLCKAFLPYVYFTKNKQLTFEELDKKENLEVDTVNNIKFDCKESYKKTIKCLRLECQEEGCSFLAEEWNSLKSHVVLSHNKVFCELCLVHKKVFCFEQTLFTQDQLVHHYSCKGSCNYNHPDKDQNQGFRGHPICGFCHVHFYEKGQYFEHLRDFHEQCHICQRKQPNILHSDYYRDYDTLEQHFYHEHFLCTFPECLERKFVVFESQQEMIHHHEMEHIHQAHNQIPHLQFDGIPPPMPLHPQFHPHHPFHPAPIHPPPAEQFTNRMLNTDILRRLSESPISPSPNQLAPSPNPEQSRVDHISVNDFHRPANRSPPSPQQLPILNWMGRAKI